MQRTLLLLSKTFTGHRGRPGHVGGSAPRAAADGRGGGDKAQPSVELPDSSGIKTAAEALAYWNAHLANRTFEIQMAVGKGLYGVSIYFHGGNHHAWTRAARAGETPDAWDRPGPRTGPRIFDPHRAVLMDRLLPTLRAPWAVLGQENRDVVIQAGLLPSGEAYTVTVKLDGRGHYELVSAYPRPKEEVAKLRREWRARPPAGLPANTLKKTETPAFWAGVGSHAVLPFVVPSGHGGAELHPVASPAEARRPIQAAQYLSAFCDLFKALPPGARWITVHPNGEGTKGQPVLVQPAENGAMRVIGGAGGRLNYLKLRGVKSADQYKAEAAEKAKTHREQQRDKRVQEKAQGIAPSKNKAREAVKLQHRAERDAFVQTVAQAMKWTDADTRFPEEQYQNAPAGEYRKAVERHAQQLYQRAKEAVAHQRAQLLADADRRDAAGLGTVPLEVPEDQPEQLSVADLDPVTGGEGGLGFNPAYSKRAEAAGLTPDELAAEVAEAKGKEPPPPRPESTPTAKEEGGREGATTDSTPTEKPKKERPKDTGEAMGDALEVTREPGPKVDPKAKVDARVAMELLKAEKRLRQAGKAARQRMKEIDGAKGPVEPQAFVLESGPVLDRSVMADLADDLKTLRTTGFLSAVEEAGGVEALGNSVSRGAFASVNALALAAGGAALLDRSVVDVLGPAGAAQVLAARLHQDLTPEEFGHAREALQRFHVDHYMKRSTDALAEAKEWHEQAAEISLGEAASGADLAVAQELNARRREFASKARQVLGQALGEMETNAALAVAMERPDRGQVQVSLGQLDAESAIKRVRAIGLQRGDYQIEKVGPSTILTINRDGMSRLAAPVAREDMEAVRRNLDIIEGKHDEDGWLPKGFANRPDIGLDLPAGAAPRLARAFPERPADIRQAVADYIGGRMADGDAPAEIIASLSTNDMLERSGDRQAMLAALDELAPTTDADGNLVRVEQHADAFEKLADDYVARKFGGTRQPIHRQQVAIDDVSADALHRALAAHPEGVAAFKAIGDMTPQDQKALRQVFLEEHGRTDAESKALADKVRELDAKEPEKERAGLFGMEITPEWTEWAQERNAAAEAANKAAMTWPRYVAIHGSPAAAYAAIQDVVRGRVLAKFAQEHNRLRPDAPLRTGRAVIRGDLQHLDALDPAARAKREEERRELADSLRSRVGGKYAAGSVADKMAAARAADEAAEQAQLGMFGFDEPPAPKAGAGDDTPLPEDTRELGLGERATIGHAAERQVAKLMQQVGRNFRPGQKVELWKPTMDGRFAGRQRAIKLAKAAKRISLAQGVGSGKTSMMQGAFTELHAEGKVKRGLFLVPSIVQGQFGSEALIALQPGKYNWHAAPGASREERLAHYRDPSTHFSVVTHQAFRDDMLHLAAERDGMTKEAVAEKLEGMEPTARADFMRELMQQHGMDHDFVSVDEGHGLLNREGKKDSTLANVVDAVTHHMPYYLNCTADPVKNDESEAFDLLRKMNPQRYTDRDAFMRKFGSRDPATRAALRREMARHLYPGRIDSGVEVKRQQITVPLGEEQHARLAELSRAAGKARIARMEGRVDVEAARTLMPEAFKDVPEGDHERVAQGIHDAIGIAHDTAKKHVLDGGAKIDHVARIADERRGRQGVVFARRLEHVRQIAQRLQDQGHKVVTITGMDTSKTKAEKLRAFKSGQHGIVVASDAGAVGANMQTGSWLVQTDIPQTAMLSAQRAGRVDRVGQKNAVELMNLVSDHPDERRALDRLARKFELREALTTPMEGLDDTGLAGYLARVKAGKADEAEPHFAPVPTPEPATAAAEPEPEEQGFLF